MSARLPVRTQTTQSECGLCCCLALLEHSGHYASISEVRQEIQAGRDGTSLPLLKRFLESRGMTVRVFRANGPEALRKFDRPVMLHWEGRHYVLLERMRGQTAYLMDPAVGRRRVGWSEITESFSGVVLEATPTENVTPRTRPPLSEWRTAPIPWGSVARPLAMSGLLAVLLYLATLLLPVFTAKLVDAAVTGASSGLWQTALVVVPAAMVMFTCVHVLRAMILARLVVLMGGGLMEGVFRHLIRLPMEFFSVRAPGELMFRLASTNIIRDALSSRLVQAGLDIGLAITLLAYIATVNLWLFAVTAGAFGLTIGFLALTRASLHESLDSEISYLTQAQAVQHDALTSMAQLKMGGYAEGFYERWLAAYRRSLSAMARRMRLQMGWIGGVLAGIQTFVPILLLLVGLQMHAGGAMSLGDTVAAQSLVAILFGLGPSIFQGYGEFVQSGRYLERIEDIVCSEPEPTGGRRTTLAGRDIALNGVSFAYATHSPKVLDGIDLVVPAGTTTSIVGPSGSGKSTLAKVVCGLYQVSDGTVRLGGVPLMEHDLLAVRRRIGYVPQEPGLHNGSIVENLALGSNLEHEEIIEFCRSLGFMDFVDAMPMGYRTVVSELGANLSGGQRQRVAIARALVNTPEIVVLDEATSALDTVTEAAVMRVIAELGCTRLVLAHRLTTIQHSSQILVLDQGRIAEVGTHDDLLDSNGLYAALYAEVA